MANPEIIQAKSKIIRAYIDCDGVVIADRPDASGSKEHRLPSGFASEKVMGRLASLEADKHWLTTWDKREVDELQSKVGIVVADSHIARLPDDIQVSQRIYYDQHPIDWKLRAIIEHQGSKPAPFIWADDLIDPEIEEMARKAFGPTPILCVVPDRQTGLQTEHFDAMEDFCKIHGAPEQS